MARRFGGLKRCACCRWHARSHHRTPLEDPPSVRNMAWPLSALLPNVMLDPMHSQWPLQLVLHGSRAMWRSRISVLETKPTLDHVGDLNDTWPKKRRGLSRLGLDPTRPFARSK